MTIEQLRAAGINVPVGYTTVEDFAQDCRSNLRAAIRQRRYRLINEYRTILRKLAR